MTRNSWIFCKMVIVIILIVSCVTILIGDPKLSIRYRNTEYVIDIPKNANNSTIYYPQNGIDIAIVCANDVFNEMAISTIKSIMFHRRRSYQITFHIFTDVNGEKRFSDYGNLSANRCTKFRIYPIEKLLELGKKFLEKHKIVVTHYSGIYALSKAFIHEVLPSNLHRILLIDTDILFLDDAYSIWEQFRLFKQNITALSLMPWYPSVPSDYQYKGSAPDPFVAGVILLDLNVCRSIHLTQLISQATTIAQERFGLKTLWTADQVVLSLFATFFSEHVIPLPCFFNGHTVHHLKNGLRWKSGCGEEYPRIVHVVPSSDLLNKNHYFGHLYIFFKEMPIEWLSYCGK